MYKRVKMTTAYTFVCKRFSWMAPIFNAKGKCPHTQLSTVQRARVVWCILYILVFKTKLYHLQNKLTFNLNLPFCLGVNTTTSSQASSCYETYMSTVVLAIYSWLCLWRFNVLANVHACVYAMHVCVQACVCVCLHV